jgi:hypothetical protein
MDEPKAIEILRTLATGLNPMTGEAIPAAGPFESPDIVRALCLGADALESRAKQARRGAGLPRNAGKSWSKEEDERLLAAFDAGTTIPDLATAHERTRSGIEARLVKHGRLEVEQASAARIR